MLHRNIMGQKGFRQLDAAELEMVSGGNEIIVTGTRPDNGGWVSVLPDDLATVGIFGFGGDVGGDFQDPFGGSGGEGGAGLNSDDCSNGSSEGHDGESQYPSGFDRELDQEVDALAAEIADDFLTLPNHSLNESIALIWIDGAGNLQRTGVHEGTPDAAPIGAAWPEVDFANGGTVVGIIHSHPTHFASGAGIVPTQSNQFLSNGDFDTLQDAANGTLSGFDQDNVRSYVAQDGNVNEYYAFDQDSSQYGQDSATTVNSVESSDYDENTGQENNQC